MLGVVEDPAVQIYPGIYPEQSDLQPMLSVLRPSSQISFA